MPVIPLWLGATLVATSGIILSPRVIDYNLFFMKFFRNLSRSKARARLHNNKFAIIPVMLGIEQPLKIKDDFDAENTMTITREMLEEMVGYDGAPLYLSIKGRVYDVSAGHKFYGEGHEYHDWVGRDASRSFGTGCRGGVDKFGVECLSESLDGLTEAVSWSRILDAHAFITSISSGTILMTIEISFPWKSSPHPRIPSKHHNAPKITFPIG